MSRIIMLIPTGSNVGLTAITLGTLRSIERQGLKVNLFKPVAQPVLGGDKSDHTTTLINANSQIKTNAPLKMSYVEDLLETNQQDVLMEEIIAQFASLDKDADVILVEGIVPSQFYPFANELNLNMAKTLGAEVILATSMDTDSASTLAKRLEVARSNFGASDKIIGAIVNKVNATPQAKKMDRPDVLDVYLGESTDEENVTLAEIQAKSKLPILGAIPWNIELVACRSIDIANHLNATIINEGDIKTRRIKYVSFCARSVDNVLSHFRPDALLITSADRPEIIIAISLAVMNGLEIGGILLTGGYKIAPAVTELCKQAFATGLPIFSVDTNTFQTSVHIQQFNLEIPADDKERLEYTQNFIADHIAYKWQSELGDANVIKRLSPPAFRYQLTELARKAHKTIVLPEGDEPRTIKAAAICAEKGIANCLLLGHPDEVLRVAALQGITFNDRVTIIDPEQVREKYVPRLVELRKSKGLTEELAREQLQDNVVLGTMMLECNEVDGLVSGAVHTTANTIRPPLQLIKTAPGSSLVSSVFFMLMPEQVYIYGDCAINPDPNAEELAEIAIQSADTAIAFGIEPKVAMISYSTGNSGKGADVEKVKEATRIAQEKRPDLLIDGPLQYDAAVMADVAKSKAPTSKVAGQATVFIFPDLNTGNTTYKAVQRSADLVSIGPMLQGMRKPVNDLSRGALVDDIVYTIALTAIQATQ